MATETRSSWLVRFTIPLNKPYLQTRKTVALERALPGEELLLGELITVQGFLHSDLAVAHRSNHRRFATGHPSPDTQGRCIVHYVCARTISCHTYSPVLIKLTISRLWRTLQAQTENEGQLLANKRAKSIGRQPGWLIVGCADRWRPYAGMVRPLSQAIRMEVVGSR